MAAAAAGGPANFALDLGSSGLRIQGPMGSVEPARAEELVVRRRVASADRVRDAVEPLVRMHEACNLCVVMPADSPRSEYSALGKELMEIPNIKACYLTSSFSSGLLAAGKLSGLVVDAGLSGTHAAYVHDGILVKNSTVSLKMSGEQITNSIAEHLGLRRGIRVSVAEAEAIKLACGRISLPDGTRVDASTAATWEEWGDEDSSRSGYTLPDGSVIASDEQSAVEDICTSHWASEGETLFTQAMSRPHGSIPEGSPRPIVLIGGGARMRGLPTRLAAVALDTLPATTLVSITRPPDPERLPLVGASILTGLGSFQSLAVSRAEFEENGQRVFEPLFNE